MCSGWTGTKCLSRFLNVKCDCASRRFQSGQGPWRMWLWNFREPLFEALVRTASHHHPFLITPGSIIIIVRHGTAVLSVLAVRCIQIPSSVTWLLGRGHGGDARDSRRQDRHYTRKVARILGAIGRHPLSNLDSSVSHFSHKASLFSCNHSKGSPRQDPITSEIGTLVTDKLSAS